METGNRIAGNTDLGTEVCSKGDVYEGITDKGVAALDNSVVNCVLHPVSPNEERGVARFSNNGFRVNWCIRIRGI